MSFTQSHTATWGLASCPRILQHMDWSMDRSTNIYSLTATYVLLLILYNWCHAYMYVYVHTRISKNLKISVFNVTGKNWVHIIVICRYSVDKYNKATKTNDKNTALWENKRRRCYAGSWCVCVCVCMLACCWSITGISPLILWKISDDSLEYSELTYNEKIIRFW